MSERMFVNGPPAMPEVAAGMPLSFLKARHFSVTDWDHYETEWAPVSNNAVTAWQKAGCVTVADVVERQAELVTTQGGRAALIALRYGWLPIAYQAYLQRIGGVLTRKNYDRIIRRINHDTEED